LTGLAVAEFAGSDEAAGTSVGGVGKWRLREKGVVVVAAGEAEAGSGDEFGRVMASGIEPFTCDFGDGMETAVGVGMA